MDVGNNGCVAVLINYLIPHLDAVKITYGFVVVNMSP